MENEFTARYIELGANAEIFRYEDCIRVNPLKITAEALIERLKKKGFQLEKVKFLENGYFVRKARHSISALPEYLHGYFYIQEAASQLPAQVLNPSNEDIVLDACAAPGGKTTQLAVKAKAVIAVESQHNRMPALVNNIERMGMKNIICCNTDARTFEPEIKFNKILVDAPCSGNYISDNKWFGKQKITNFTERAEIQKEILSNVANFLEDNGELVYSTCSLEPEEDEMVVDWAIKELGMKVLDIDCIGDKGISNPFGKELDKQVEKCRRLWPYKTRTQGFFIAKLGLK
ncbi:MAG: RsmB/NOP family class I SAM-dependent RNA methyltransferase [Candidatus Nanoarchaeia archaeon]|nr:RsmB/NOP family class I SAM-dependent RNA methyltransferase [Candidatus Nanoarchaeia archaeon]